jgi:hypothetical protein
VKLCNTCVVQFQSHMYCTVSFTQVLYSFIHTSIVISFTQVLYSFTNTGIVQFNSNRFWIDSLSVIETAQYMCDWICTMPVLVKLYNACVNETVNTCVSETVQALYSFTNTGIVQIQSHMYCAVSITHVLYSFIHTAIVQFHSHKYCNFIHLYNACVSETVQYLC